MTDPVLRIKFPQVSPNEQVWYAYETKRLLRSLITTMRLTAWHITLDLSDAFSDRGSKAASVFSNPVYMNATIRLYKKFYELEFEDQLSTLVHELFHVIVSPTAYAQQCSAYPEAVRISIFESQNARAYDDAEETVVQNLTRMFVPIILPSLGENAKLGKLTIEIRKKLGAKEDA